MQRYLRPRGLATVAIAALLAASCGEDDGDDAAVTTTTTTTEARAEEAGGETVDITAVNYAFQGVPATMPAGSTITLVNDSEDEVHEVVAFRINDDADISVEDMLALPEEELGQYVTPGPPAMVLVAPPGGDGFPAVGDGTLTEPGRYALACFIPTGADPQEYLDAAQEGGEGPPQVEGGPPHFTQGMFAELTVE